MTDSSRNQGGGGTESIKGTGGIPNLRVVQDFATNPPELFFELHTQIKLKHEHLDRLNSALASRDFRALASLMIEHGELDDRVSPDELATLLAVLYVVDNR